MTEGSDAAIWRTSSYSGGNGGQCVEVGHAVPVILIRDTKDRGSLVLAVTISAWQTFTGGLK